jgi:hypothetical protein
MDMEKNIKKKNRYLKENIYVGLNGKVNIKNIIKID